MTISVRPGRMAIAARASLYSNTVVESPIVVCPGAAPRVASARASPMVTGRSNHCSSQPRIRRPPQASIMKVLIRSTLALVGRPNEFPSRYALIDGSSLPRNLSR